MEIDIVAKSRDKIELIIGEAKWSSTRNIQALLKELDKKVESFPKGDYKRIHKALFIKEKAENIPEGYHIFTPTDIVCSYNPQFGGLESLKGLESLESLEGLDSLFSTI